MHVAERIERWLLTIQSLLAEPAASYVDLETADTHSSHTLVTPAGSLVSLVSIEGAKSITTGAWINNAIGVITEELTTRFSEQGHTLQTVISYDPSKAAEQARASIAPMRNAARAMGSDLDGALVDWADSVARYTSAERVYIAVWTHPNVLPKAEADLARKERGKMIKNTPQAPGAQNIAACVEALRDRHQALCTSITSAMRGAGILSTIIDAHTACHWMRHELDPHMTGKEWRALLPGDPPVLRTEWAAKGEMALLYPDLAGQIMPREAERYNAKTIRIGDQLHRPLVLKLPPQNPKTFRELFGRLIQMPFPWRVSLRISGDGLGGNTINRSLAAVLSRTSRINKQYHRAMEQLEELQLSGGCIVKFQAEFDTWVHAEDPQAEKRLAEQGSRLTAAVQGWGSSDVSEVVGDPLLGVCASVGGVSPGSPSPPAAAPLSDAIKMQPFTRPAQIWRSGVPFRSPDGKLLPYQPGSSKQTAWIDLIMAPLGRGKSVYANTINFAHWLQPGLEEPPYLTIVDVGPSSLGLVEMIQDSLPAQKRYLAAYRRLHNTAEDGINPCDLPLGCTEPFPVHKSFLISFMTQLAMPMGNISPPDVTGLAERCITRAYEECAPAQKPKVYTPGTDEEVDKAVNACGFEPQGDVTWYTVSRVLFDAGKVDMATQAQRYAVPTVGEIARYSNDPEISGAYQDIIFQGEALPHYFRRKITESLRLYPLISGVTRINFGAARVIVLDLDEVAKHGTEAAERQSAIMYMLALQVGAAHFFYQPDDIAFVPEAYKEYHKPRFDALRAIPKRLFFDEWHHVSMSDVVSQLVGNLFNMIARESRKWNIHIALASQDMGDFKDFIVNIATGVHVLGASMGEAERIASKMRLPKGAEHTIRRLRAPNRAGSELLSIIYTTDGEPVVNHLTNTLGGEMRIGFDSNAKTSNVRRRLSDIVGAAQARRLLATHYPNGVAEELERRTENMAAQGQGDDEQSQIEQLIEELLAKNEGGMPPQTDKIGTP